MFSRLSITFCTLILTLNFSALTLASTKHALLVGINDYPIQPLQGPQFDVIAIKKALTKNMGFENTNITTLLNEEATKSGILNAIDDLYKKSKKDDQVFIYFSGHGTSASDNNFNFPLPTTTGAFIPYDVIADTNDKLVQPRLIVGKTDLRPRLSMLDQGGRSVFVIMDACYSGNTVRGIQTTFTLPKRFMNLNKALTDRGMKMDWAKPISNAVNRLPDDGTPDNKAPNDRVPNNEVTSNAYPYKNIYFLSASGEHEVALEISEARLKDYPTTDGKPHGAFTDSLLKVFNDPMRSDQDKNGKVSYSELRSSLRAQMESRKFNHTPQGLPSLLEDTNDLNNKEVLLWTTRSFPLGDEPAKPQKPSLKIATNKENQSNNNTLKLLYLEDGISLSTIPKGVKVTLKRNEADYLLVRQGDDITWLANTGDIILTAKRPNDLELINQLQYLVWRDQIKTLKNTGSHAVQVELLGKGKGTTARNNESIGFGINLSNGGQVLLVNADSTGQLTVLYPQNEAELEKIEANSLVKLPNFATIQAPCGQDTLFAIAFKETQPYLKELTNTSFRYDSNTAKSLIELLENTKSNRWGLDYLSLNTAP